jgi:hypothetical protein
MKSRQNLKITLFSLAVGLLSAQSYADSKLDFDAVEGKTFKLESVSITNLSDVKGTLNCDYKQLQHQELWQAIGDGEQSTDKGTARHDDDQRVGGSIRGGSDICHLPFNFIALEHNNVHPELAVIHLGYPDEGQPDGYLSDSYADANCKINELGLPLIGEKQLDCQFKGPFSNDESGRVTFIID